MSFDKQPAYCRLPLPPREVSDSVPSYLKRVMFYNPYRVYERVKDVLNVYNRYNWTTINFSNLFPEKQDGTCDCGCGRPLAPGRRRWADNECQLFTISVWNVIGGRQDFIGEVFKAYYGDKLCHGCGERDWVDIDHIFPVSKGGGGCWLSNFQGLCKKCHKEKTRSDFGWTKLKTTKDDNGNTDDSNPLRAGRDEQTSGI